jgi:hypothetical protein
MADLIERLDNYSMDWRDRAADVQPVRDAIAALLAKDEALQRAERKLTAYVGVCKGDKELTDAVLPMVRAALSNAHLSPGTADIPEALLREAREQINRYADTAREHDLVARIDAALARSAKT